MPWFGNESIPENFFLSSSLNEDGSLVVAVDDDVDEMNGRIDKDSAIRVIAHLQKVFDLEPIPTNEPALKDGKYTGAEE